MISEFKKHLAENFSFLIDRKIILATSGGIDSMVLLHLLQQLNFDIAVAHCNFQLRGLESFEDQKFIQNYTNVNVLPFFSVQFDTIAFAEDNKLSIQVAARELRYNWFYELLASENYDYLLTAHHADDNLETFLINLSRGTGIEGLTGIPAKNDKVIRPLLAFSQETIENYAKTNNIIWREDSSNASDKYLRNKIRHDLVPILKALNPNFLNVFSQTQDYLQQAAVMVEDASIIIYQQVAQEIGDDIHINLKKLLQLPNYKSYLYQWLHEFGFSAWRDIYDLVLGESGKKVYSKEYILLKNRNFLILTPKNAVNEKEEFLVSQNHEQVNFPLKLQFCKVTDNSNLSNTTIFVDEDKLQYPLVLRQWKTGDVFYPLGMDGKSKKVSKFFKDEKFSIIEKEKIWLLCSDNQIVWITGIRQDDRFKVTETTQKKLKISISL